jgi:hypothetical protein
MPCPSKPEWIEPDLIKQLEELREQIDKTLTALNP